MIFFKLKSLHITPVSYMDKAQWLEKRHSVNIYPASLAVNKQIFPVWTVAFWL